MQGEINKLQLEAKRSRQERVRTASTTAFEELYPKLKDRNDLEKLEAERNTVASEDTDGTVLGLASRRGKVSAYDEQINQIKASRSPYAERVKLAWELVNSKMQKAAADGLNAGEPGTMLGTNGDTVLLMGSELEGLITNVTNRVSKFGQENNISASDPQILKEIYRQFGEQGAQWNLQNYDPERIIPRKLEEVNPYYYESNSDIVNKSTYEYIQKNRKAPGDEYRLIHELFPIGEDKAENKKIRRMHNAMYFHIRNMDRKRAAEEASKIKMSETEVANQGLSNTYRELSRQSGWDLSNGKEDYSTNIFSSIGNFFGSLFSIDAPIKYPFQDQVPYSINEIDLVKDYLQNKAGNKDDPFQGMDAPEINLLLKNTIYEAELKAQKLATELTTERNVKMEKENDKLKKR